MLENVPIFYWLMMTRRRVYKIVLDGLAASTPGIIIARKFTGKDKSIIDN